MDLGAGERVWVSGVRAGSLSKGRQDGAGGRHPGGPGVA